MELVDDFWVNMSVILTTAFWAAHLETMAVL